MMDQRSQLLADIEFGRDGYLFFRGNASFEQVCEAKTLDDRLALVSAARLAERFVWCAAQGIPYFVLIVPEKWVVYSDMLPAGLPISRRRPAALLLDAIDPALRPYVLYPEAELRAGRATEPTYFRTDSHWSRWGAYLGYRALLDRINQHFSQIAGGTTMAPITEADVDMPDKELIGDLGARLDPEPVEHYRDVWPKRQLPFRQKILNRSFGTGQVNLWEHDNAALPRCVMFRSSNATHLLDPFLVWHFSRMVAVAAALEFHEDLVLAERPDCVITEIPERYLAVPSGQAGHLAMEFPAPSQAAGFTAATGLSFPLDKIFDR